MIEKRTKMKRWPNPKTVEVVTSFLDCVPEKKYIRADETPPPSSFPFSDVTRILEQSKQAFLKKIGNGPHGSFRDGQKTTMEIMFDAWSRMLDENRSREEVGLALYDFLIALSTFIVFTSSGKGLMDLCDFQDELKKTVRRKGKFLIEGKPYSLVHFKGRQPRKDVLDIYKEFDKLKSKHLLDGLKLNPSQLLDKYEHDLGRRLPFLIRSKIVASYAKRSYRAQRNQKTE